MKQKQNERVADQGAEASHCTLIWQGEPAWHEITEHFWAPSSLSYPPVLVVLTKNLSHQSQHHSYHQAGGKKKSQFKRKKGPSIKYKLHLNWSHYIYIKKKCACNLQNSHTSNSLGLGFQSCKQDFVVSVKKSWYN